MADNKKYFLDLTGLTSLWEKIKANFANKADVQTEFGNLNTTIGGIQRNIQTLDGEIDTANANILAITPKSAANYTAAVELAKTLVPGTIIKVNGAQTVGSSMYVGGFYIVETGGENATIQYVGTSTGSTDEEDALKGRIEALENAAVTSVNYGDGTTTKEYQVVNNNLMIKYDDTYVPNSDSVNALTHKAIAAKFGAIEGVLNTLSGIPKFTVAVVDALPESDISPATIYLVKNTDASTNNLYVEYLYVEKTANEWVWEKLGEQTLDIDNYYTKEDVEGLINNAISSLASKTYVGEAIATATSEILGQVNTAYVKSADLDSLVLTSITEGAVGAGMAITPAQIDALS